MARETKEITVARINAKQAIIVAIISALSGILITLFSTGQLGEESLTKRQKITIDNLILLDESQIARDDQGKYVLTKIQKRANFDYKNDAFKMAIALVVSGFQTEEPGNCDIDGDISLHSPINSIADFGRLPKTVNPNEWKSRHIPENLKMGDIQSALGNTDDKLVFIQILTDFDTCVIDTSITGTAEFRIVIYDNVDKSFDEESVKLRIIR